MKNKTILEIMNLKGKTALVTGGAMGIGLGIAKRLGEAGAKVILGDIDDEAGRVAVENLKASQYDADFMHLDVSKESEIEEVINNIVEKYGGLDIVVNNAGIYPSIPALSLTGDDIDKILSINLKGSILVAKASANQMIKAGKGGKIINITSIDALHPSSVGLATYDASKHGLWGFTKNLALELAPHNIQVNAIAPGGIATPGTGAGKEVPEALKKTIESFLQKIPMKRMGEADEIGKVALFLASDLSSYMTGSQTVVDGGVLLS